jgi:Recombinase
MEGVLAAFAQFDNDCRSDRTRAGIKAALELGRWTFLAPIGYLNAPRAMGKSLMADPERAPLVRRAFEEYDTGRFNKEQLLKEVRAWGLTNRRGRPLTSQAIGVLLRNQLYAGIVDVTEYGVCGQRADFEPLISEDLFYRVQAVLSGRVPSTTPQQRAHPDFPLRAFVRCESCGRGLTGSWSKDAPSFEMSLRKCATGAGLQIALEGDCSPLIREFDGDVKLPRAVARNVGAAAGVVIGEAGVDVRSVTDVEVWLRIGTLENVNESPVLRHTR